MKKENQSVYWGEFSFYKSTIEALVFSAIVLVIDRNNMLSQLISNYGIREVIIGVCFCVLTAILCFGRRHIADLSKMPCGNAGDEFFFSNIISCLLIGICEEILGMLVCYKLIILLAIVIISMVVVIARYCFCRIRKSREKNISNRVVDLEQLISGEIKEYNLPLIFSEEASEYDLLGREGLVNVIYNSINICNPNHVYVIGLKGAWGSGKTTVLNIVKKKISENRNDVIVIDDFDPWMFGSQEALLCGMYDVILSKTGIKYSTYSSKQTVHKLKETVVNKNKLSSLLGTMVEIEQRDYETVKQLKEKIGVYLRQLKMPIVFMIDNLDRAEAENVLFLFKLIGSVFDLPNIIYVLSYDGERIQKVFSDINKVNPKYIEKIIQQEIVIPEIQKDTLVAVCSSCIERTLLAYGVRNREIVQFKDISDLICNNVSDLRQFKRLLNSSFVTTFLYDNELYKPHLLSIEVIRFLEPNLYEEIKRNKKYFVSKDLIYSSDRLYLETTDKKRFNESAKNYYLGLFEKYRAYEDVLVKLFPYVKRYKNGVELLSDYTYDDAPEHNSIASIASSKYFDLYFSYGANDFLKIHSNVEQFIVKINSSDINNVELVTEKAIEVVDKNAQIEWFGCLQNKLDTINEKVRKKVAIGICNSLRKIDTTRGFLMLSADQRALVIATKLLKGTDSTEIISVIEDLSKNYNICLLEEIRRNCEIFEKRGDSDFTELKKITGEKYCELCNEIIKKNIDIYEADIYQRKKLWFLYRSIPEEEKEIIHDYMRSIINEHNIFKILSDMISESSGTMGFGYAIKEVCIKDFFGEKEILQCVLRKAIPSNDTEKFILSLWERMESGEENEFGEKDFYSPVPINLIP